jgi:hypothetical protein
MVDAYAVVVSYKLKKEVLWSEQNGIVLTLTSATILP